jgi:hypothetical protein
VRARRQQSKLDAHSIQNHLEKERSRKLLQVEHISFIFTALLETPLCFEETRSIITKEKRPLEQQEKQRKEVVLMR